MRAPWTPTLLALAAGLAAQGLPPAPDVVYAPRETHYGAYAVPGNLLAEGTSFETGATAALDGGWTWDEHRSYVRWIAAGQVAAYLTTHEPPRVVPTPSPVAGVTHGGRSVELRMRNRSSLTLAARPFRAPAGGTYTLSFAARGDPSTANRPSFSVHIHEVPGGVLVHNPPTGPGAAWQRFASQVVLQGGRWYQLEFHVASWASNIDYPDQSFWIDAVRLAPGTDAAYAHPTRGWELGARVFRFDGSGRTDRVLNDTFWIGEDEGRRRLAVDLHAAGAVPPPVTLTVNLYDSRGTPGRPSTRVATVSQAVTMPGARQTLSIDLDPLLAAAGSAPGFYLAETLLLDGGAEPVDREETPLLLLLRAPASILDPERSPFGAHPQIIHGYRTGGNHDFWYAYGVRLNASAADQLRYLRDLGVRWTREFFLFDYLVSRTFSQGAPLPPNLAWPPPASIPAVFAEYSILLRSLGVKTVPTFAGEKTLPPNHDWYRSYVREMVLGHGPLGVDAAELYNEENREGGMSAETYAGWLRSTRVEIDAVDPGFRLAGPATTYGDTAYINAVLDAVREGVTGYEMLDAITWHRYLKSYDSFPWNLLPSPSDRTATARGPEDAYIRPGDGARQCGEWEMRLMGGEAVAQLPSAPLRRPPLLGGGRVEQPVWVTEWAPALPLARSGTPVVSGADGQLLGGMSGSLLLGRRMAARAVRQVLCLLERGSVRQFLWDSSNGYPYGSWRWFEGDRTPTILPAALTHLAARLEGTDLADVLTTAELPDNGVNEYYTRAQFHLERSPAVPGDPRAVAVLWNWADDQFDHLPGSGISDPFDPAPAPGVATIPVLAIDPSRVEITDLMGRALAFAGPRVTDLVLGHEPVYIRTRPGTTPGELMLALDTIRPGPPRAPSAVYAPGSRSVTVGAGIPTPPDLSGYRCVRQDLATGLEVLVAEVAELPVIDRPPPGSYRWVLSAVERFTGYVSPPSPPSEHVLVPPLSGPSLACDRTYIDFGAGGTAAFSLDFGPAFAGAPYVLLLSLSGSLPGTPFPEGQVLPLNIDAFTWASALNPDTPPFRRFQGLLDGAGRGGASFLVPPGIPLGGTYASTTAAFALFPRAAVTDAVWVFWRP